MHRPDFASMLHTREIEVGRGFRARVLDLETLIATKEETGQEKDLATLDHTRTIAAHKRKARPQRAGLELNRATSYSPTHLRAQYHRG